MNRLESATIRCSQSSNMPPITWCEFSYDLAFSMRSVRSFAAKSIRFMGRSLRALGLNSTALIK
jgi:hypothetical protein